MPSNIQNTQNMPPAHSETTNFTKNGVCSQCGGCCTHHLRIAPTEIQTIKTYIKKHHIKPCIHTNGNEAQIDFLCPFLDTSADTCKCTIYPVRPLICQIFQCNRTQSEMIKEACRLMRGKQHLQKQFFSTTECNVGNTFFPDIYLPKKDDYVIFNQLNRNLYQKHQGCVFQVIDINPACKLCSIIPANSVAQNATFIPLDPDGNLCYLPPAGQAHNTAIVIPTDWLTKIM